MPSTGHEAKERSLATTSNTTAAIISSAMSGAAAIALARKPKAPAALRWALWGCLGLGAAVTANELTGKPVAFLRWSVLNFLFGGRFLSKLSRVRGVENALAAFVLKNTRAGDLDDVIRAIDEFCYTRSVMMNVGDEKGVILDRAVRRAQPHRLLELGTYCGYSALRTIRAMPDGAHLYSVEMRPENAEVARRILVHAGVADRVTIVVGHLGDGGTTLRRLRTEYGFTAGSLDFVFIDHDKRAYLPDLQHILDEGWLHQGSVVVADNVKYPGAPEYHDYMRQQEGKMWRTREHRTHVEYQSLIRDLVLESDYLGPDGLG